MLTFNAITHTCNMGRHQTKTCKVCFKSMRGDHLKRHMKKHDVKTEDNDVTKGLHDGKTEDDIGTNEEQISCIDEELEKSVSAQMDEFDRKMELGRYVKLVVDKHGYNVNGLDNDMKEALKTYELHGETKSLIGISLKKITHKAVEDLDNLQKTREKKIREKKTREKRSKLGIIKQMNNNVM